MDAPTLQVTVAAPNKNLVTLAALKTQLGITGSTDDAELTAIIGRVTAAIVGYCNLTPDQNGGSTFGRETMIATWLGTCERRGTRIVLPWRIPVVSITSVVEDGTTLVATDYRAIPMAAMLERICDDYPSRWSSGKIVVTYVAGYLMPDDGGTTLPADLQAAALYECTARWMGKTRDPLLRSEAIPDVYSQTWAASGGSLDMSAGVLPETAGMLSRYRAVPV